MSSDWTWTWYDENDTSFALTEANGVRVMPGVYGLDTPPVTLNLQDNTAIDGSTLTRRRVPSRPFIIPMYLNDGDSARDLIQSLSSKFRGPGTFQVSDGVRARELRQVYYESGLEGDWSRDRAISDEWIKVAVSFVAVDPYWYTSVSAEGDITSAATTTTTFDNSGTQFDIETTPFNGGGTSVENVFGDAPAFPTWTITGEFTGLTIGLEDGDSFTVATDLGSGATIVIDCDPTSPLYGPRVAASGRVNWTILTPDSRLFALPVGQPTLIAGAISSDGNSEVTMTWEERYNGP